MSHFDEAYSAVQAALDAGARYADARIMVRRTESMTARDGDVEDLSSDESAGVGVRALVGSSWGFYAVPDLSDAASRLEAARVAFVRRDDDVLVIDPAATGDVALALVERLLPGDPRGD